MSAQTSFYNHSVRIVAAVIGVAIIFAGLTHNYWEIRQGNLPATGIYINSVGPEQLKWSDGQDPAITLIPNFLATGIVGFIFGTIAVIWTVFFIHKRYGPSVFLTLMIAQTLSGGGIGYIPFYLVVWAYATRITKPLTWWNRVLSDGLRRGMALLWVPAMIGAAILWIVLLEASIFGFFWETIGKQQLLNTIWGALLVVMILTNIAYVGAISKDLIER